MQRDPSVPRGLRTLDRGLLELASPSNWAAEVPGALDPSLKKHGCSYLALFRVAFCIRFTIKSVEHARSLESELATFTSKMTEMRSAAEALQEEACLLLILYRILYTKRI